MEATVAERGQITLPKAARDALGLAKGSKLKVEVENGRIVQRGTHEQLMREEGPYLHVANLQLVDNRELQQLKLREGAA